MYLKPQAMIESILQWNELIIWMISKFESNFLKDPQVDYKLN